MTMKSPPLKMQKLFTGGCNKFWFSFSHLGKLSGGSRGISEAWSSSLFRVGGYSNILCPFLEFVISYWHVMCMKPRALNSCVCLAIPFKYSGFWTSSLHPISLHLQTFTTLATRKTRPGTGKYEVLVERMVSSSTPAAQVSENEKKRKQAMEKIKANHVRPLLTISDA